MKFIKIHEYATPNKPILVNTVQIIKIESYKDFSVIELEHGRFTVVESFETIESLIAS